MAELLFRGRAEPPLIDVRLLELLGIPMLVLDAPALPLLLLPDDTKEVADASEAGKGREPLAMPSISAFGVRERPPPLKSPIPRSGFPPAYNEPPFLLLQVHPVNNMPRLHAPIRPARGILRIVLSSPCDSFHTTPNPSVSHFWPPHLAPAGLTIAEKSAKPSLPSPECQYQPAPRKQVESCPFLTRLCVRSSSALDT